MGLTQLLTEMNTRNISWGKCGWFVGLTTDHLHVLIVLKYGSLNLLETSGPVQACNGIALLTYLLTYVLTPWSRVLLEKLTSNLCS